jgi:hypothetical protein
MGIWRAVKTWVLPRPDIHFRESQRYADSMFQNFGRGDYALGIADASGYMGHGMMTVLSVVPGVSKLASKFSRASTAASKSSSLLSRSSTLTSSTRPTTFVTRTPATVSRSYGRREAVKLLAKDKATPSAWKPFLDQGRNPFGGKGSKAVRRALTSNNEAARKWAQGQIKKDGTLKTIKSGYDLAHKKGMEFHKFKTSKELSAAAWKQARFKDRMMHQTETKLQNLSSRRQIHINRVTYQPMSTKPVFRPPPPIRRFGR